MSLLSKGINIRGEEVPLYDGNPYARLDGDSTLLIIHDLPLSYSNDEILKWLERMKIQVTELSEGWTLEIPVFISNGLPLV